MLCQVPEDYYLKQFSAQLSVSSALTLPDEIFIEGVSTLTATVDIVANCDAIKAPVNYLNVAICDLQVHWQPSTTYRFRFLPDFFRDPENQPNPQFDVTYTTNPLPAIPSANPAFGSTDVINNTTIRLEFDRKMRRGNAGNIYLYEVASPSNLLIGTYSNLSNITLANDGASITFSTLGKLKANTQYYILSDANIYRDYDNFYLPQITSASFYTFTTDQSPDNFPDLITIQFVTGSIDVDYIRRRNLFSNYSTVDSTVAVSDRYRLRRPPLQPQTVESNIVSAMTYNTGKLQSNFETVMFESLDNVLTYNKGGLASNLLTDTLLSILYRRFRAYVSNQSADFNLSNSYIRRRPFVSQQSADFSQSSIGDWGLLDSTRNSDSYSTNTTTTINGGPILRDKRVTTAGNYTLSISPSDVTAINTLSVPEYITANLQLSGSGTGRQITACNNKFSASQSLTGIVIRNLSNNAIVTTIAKFPLSMDMSEDYFAFSEYASGDNNTVYVYRTSDWTLVTTITNPNAQGTTTGDYFGWCVAVNNNIVAVSAFGDGAGSTQGSVYIFNISTGALTRTFINPGSGTTGEFGWDIDVNSTSIIISDTGYSGWAGIVYIYNINSGALEQTITNPQNLPSYPDYFGAKVQINETNFIILRGTRASTGDSPGGKVFYYSLGSGTPIRSFSIPYGLPPGGPWPTFAPTDNTIYTIGFNSQYLIVGHAITSSYNGTSYTYYDQGGTINSASLLVVFDINTGSMVHYVIGLNQSSSNHSSICTSASINDLNDIVFHCDGAGNGLAVFQLTKNTSSFNAITKVLSITGSRLAINSAIDQITFVPTTGYTSNFVLTYTATRTSDGFVSIRFQNVNRV